MIWEVNLCIDHYSKAYKGWGRPCIVQIWVYSQRLAWKSRWKIIKRQNKGHEGQAKQSERILEEMIWLWTDNLGTVRNGILVRHQVLSDFKDISRVLEKSLFLFLQGKERPLILFFLTSIRVHLPTVAVSRLPDKAPLILSLMSK